MSMQSPETSNRPGLFGADAGRRLLWIAVTIVVFVGVVVAARGLPWDRTWQALKDAQLGWVLAALAANCVMLPLWTSQWRVLTPPAQRPPWGRMFEIVALTSLSQNILPLFGGPAAGIGLLIVRGGVSRGVAVSVLALDQMLTGLAKLSALSVAALAAPMPNWIRVGALSFTAAALALVVLLVALAFSTEWLERFAPRGIAASFAGWTRHLSGLRRAGGPVWWAFGYALAKKASEVLAALAVLYACGIELGWGAATLVVAALGLSTLARTPGNLGIYEATVVAIYSALGVPPAPALAAALLQHLVALLPRLSGGLIVLLIRRPSLSPR